MSSGFWSGIVLLGLGGWIAATLMLLFKGFPERNVFNSAAALKWGIVLLVCYAVWIAGLLNA